MAFMTFADNRLGAPTWMELIIESPKLWECVVKYGQFQPIDHSQNCKNDIMNEYGGRSEFIRRLDVCTEGWGIFSG